MIWNVAASIPTTPRLVVAIALLPFLTSPGDCASVPICPAADPWKQHPSEPSDRGAYIGEGVHSPIPFGAIIAIPEPHHGSVLHRLRTLSIRANVVPSLPERGVQSVVIPPPPPTLILSKGLSCARVVKVAPIVLSGVGCIIAFAAVGIARLLKMLEVMHIASTIGGLGTCSIVGVDHPHVCCRIVGLVSLVRVFVVWHKSIGVVWC